MIEMNIHCNILDLEATRCSLEIPPMLKGRLESEMLSVV